MSDSEASNAMRERIGDRRERVRLYVLLTMSRMVLASVLALGVFVILVGLGAYALPPFRAYMIQYAPTRYVFQAFITALITGVTLVVTISQLVLSQELGPLGDQRSRMSGAMAFRGDVEDIFGAVSPPEPAAFLHALIDNTNERAETLRETISGNSNSDLVEETGELADNINESSGMVSDELADRNFGDYGVLKAALDFNYSWMLYQARRLQGFFDKDMNEDEQRAVVDLIRVLAYFGPAREHIKTLYFEWELVNLSRRILYSSIPALVASVALGLFLAPSSFSGVTFGIDNLVWIVSAGAAISTLPFFLLTAYILRIATLAKRTLAIGSFILSDSSRSTDIEWE